MEELGSGFFLALHDLEIRGAGEVLGDQQSGNISEIGFSLYADMLKQAVESLKSGNEPDLEAPLKATIEINFHLPALLPKNYCPDVHERLTIYKRLANTRELRQLELLEGELIDRFGKIPPETAVLIEVHKFRQIAGLIGIQKIDATNEFLVIQFDDSPNLDPEKIIDLIQNDLRFKLLGPTRLKFFIDSIDFKSRSKNINECLSLLSSSRKLAA
jgi:transcription-repair coupling factor (superfamily II helicase)